MIQLAKSLSQGKECTGPVHLCRCTLPRDTVRSSAHPRECRLDTELQTHHALAPVTQTDTI